MSILASCLQEVAWETEKAEAGKRYAKGDQKRHEVVFGSSGLNGGPQNYVCLEPMTLFGKRVF